MYPYCVKSHFEHIEQYTVIFINTKKKIKCSSKIMELRGVLWFSSTVLLFIVKP